ncbi:hypothetical protein Bca52824_032745 [Brassica carinata]|uniref:Uncharacterized protein n=1 Tax=Brassica carinata TaxID=52824 RepID=A0A8X7V6H2_BRACI|nr:hypothetical protein Bca52824_032745 [Brassica carinata]
MPNFDLLNLPDEIICKIITIVGEESFWNVGPFIGVGKRGYGLVHEPCVLKRCNISPMLDFGNCEIGTCEKFSDFFLKCVNVGNINVVYYESLHLAMKCGLEEGIQVLEANVPNHGMSTLALGIFDVCLGKDIEAREIFQEFAVKHADLRSEQVIRMGDQLMFQYHRSTHHG